MGVTAVVGAMLVLAPACEILSQPAATRTRDGWDAATVEKHDDASIELVSSMVVAQNVIGLFGAPGNVIIQSGGPKRAEIRLNSDGSIYVNGRYAATDRGVVEGMRGMLDDFEAGRRWRYCPQVER